MALNVTAAGDPMQEMRASASPPAAGSLDSFWNSPLLSILLLLLVLTGLPVAVWLDLSTLSEHALREQAVSVSRMIDSIRNYYATNVVGRVAAAPHRTEALPNYADVPGAIPIPATLSLEIGALVGRSGGNMKFRFFSDHPFKNRAPHAFDDFERGALATLRAHPDTTITDVSGSLFNRQVRLITPILMGSACVSCHNTHPDSPKRDWKVGDVRGIEEFTVNQPIAANVSSFKYLIGYFVLVTVIGLSFIAVQRYQARLIESFNHRLKQTNELLATIAQKVSKYLSPQHYRSIFSGQKDVVIATERKKLTIFFSDIVGFTTTTERLQPEELTSLLNEYLTEMSGIAHAHGGTVNKYIGDAMLVFFGDPESRGVVEDARACLRMAFDMQRRLAELNVRWRERGIQQPFRTRIGINSGFVNVGNFGSDERMDYTIIGAEANLAARLQSIAGPGGIVLSYETFALVRDMVNARAIDPITLKGIAQPVVPYVVEGLRGARGETLEVISEHGPGFEVFIDLRAVDGKTADQVRNVLNYAAESLAKVEPANQDG